jgi:DNA-binding LytR/AlgR family response regulator
LKVSIEEVDEAQDEEIIVRCHKINDEVLGLIHSIKSSTQMLTGTIDDEIHRVSIKSIYYFETVDNRSFLYCEKQVYETKMKLYEFQQMTQNSRFFRASKSTIINALKISYVKPSISGRFEAFMDNGEVLQVSRQYVSDLKKQIGL